MRVITYPRGRAPRQEVARLLERCGLNELRRCTNATLSKAQAKKVAQMAQDGMARAISPAHTMGDGDTIFALATGERAEAADVTTIGALAADVLAEAIVRAVREARGIAGYPSVRDLGARR